MSSSLALSEDALKKFKEDGYAVVPNFLTMEEVESLRKACKKLVDDMDMKQHPAVVFSTTQHTQSRSEYFLNSGDNVSYFFEEKALDEKGNLTVPKEVSLNKIGHALHWLVPEFKAVSFSDKVKTVAKQLQFKSPAIVQSMYIFKQPGYGGEVTPHKDCTFLSTDPQSCIGLWFALEDCTEENGCLWFNPGTQNVATKRRFVRVKGPDGKITTDFTAPPDKDDPSKYIACPVTKGSMVVINGSVDHKSAQNTSSNSRHIYTFHIIERQGTTWDPNNWLQPTDKMPFTGLFEN